MSEVLFPKAPFLCRASVLRISLPIRLPSFPRTVSQVSEVFSVDMHPATRLGRGLLLDHGTGIVIGETAVVGDDCSFLQGVTLGGTGKESGDRHPKVRRLSLATASRGPQAESR